MIKLSHFKLTHGGTACLLLVILTIILNIQKVSAYNQKTSANNNKLSANNVSVNNKTIYVSFWHAMDGDRGRVLSELVKEFNLTHPSIIIQDRFVGTQQRFANHYNVLIRELLLALKKGEPPVLSQVYENWASQLIEAGTLVPMAQFIRGEDGISQKDVTDIFPLFRQVNSYDGVLWTVPFNKSMYVLYYNTSRFKQKNLYAPRTWEEFREVARRLTVKEKDKKSILHHGFVFQPNVDVFGVLFYSYGGEYFNGIQPVFNGPIGVAILQYLTNLVVRERAALPSFQPVEDFILGKGDMLIATTSVYPSLIKQTKNRFKLGITLLPKGTEERYPIAGTNLAIFSKATQEEQQAAWLFVRWLLRKERTSEWSERTGYLPVRMKGANTNYYKRFLKHNPAFSKIVESISKGKGDPRLPGWESVRWIITEAVEHSVTEGLSPQVSLDEAAEKVRILFSSSIGGTLHNK